MYVSINKELIIFQNFFGVLSRFPNGSGGNITLFRGQRVVRELRVEGACSKTCWSRSCVKRNFVFIVKTF